ncbi:putative calcium-binding protein CML27 [Zea mays]|uniref:Putative calcium-binding protein CML27 n=1 Tax=Zea mays TaxID=4577 RepID=A0A1D6L4U9_MAIZE|nr:putative calcium-binding protein CML27 [Zea mays]
MLVPPVVHRPDVARQDEQERWQRGEVVDPAPPLHDHPFLHPEHVPRLASPRGTCRGRPAGAEGGIAQQASRGAVREHKRSQVQEPSDSGPRTLCQTKSYRSSSLIGYRSELSCLLLVRLPFSALGPLIFVCPALLVSCRKDTYAVFS